jgi:hypothetical protein
MSKANRASAFTSVPNVAQYDGAAWNWQVTRKNGISLDEAYDFAFSCDQVTYFFRVDDGARMVLPKNGTFNAGDSVFFAGNAWFGTAPALANAYTKNAGSIDHTIAQGNYFTRLRGKMNVPVTAPAPSHGILFLWPGLQPGNASGDAADAIGNGVLQPVLTFDNGCDSCAPNPTGVNCLGSWWISGQYVNSDPTRTTPPQFRNCNGGERMLLLPGQVVDIDMSFDGATSTWLQTCKAGTQSVNYGIALTIDGQVQNQSQLLFINEMYGSAAIAGAISMYEIELQTLLPCEGLLTHLQSKGQVSGARQGADPTTILVDRIVFHSPMSQA